MFAEWIAVFRRTFKQFVADDCTGLAREVAYSAMLAFFPATAFLLGLLGVLNSTTTCSRCSRLSRHAA